MHKKFEMNQRKIKGGCQSGRKVVPKDSKSDLPLQGRSDLQSYLVHFTGNIFAVCCNSDDCPSHDPISSLMKITLHEMHDVN